MTGYSNRTIKLTTTTISLLLMVGLAGCSLIPTATEQSGPTNESGAAAEKTTQPNKLETALPAADWNESSLLYSPQQVERMKIPVKAKGIYLTGWSAGNSNFQKLLNLVNDTELNAMVIDMKEDEGRITYQSEVPMVNETGADGTTFIQDVDKLIHTVHQNNVYSIARIVCFKDPFLAGKKTEWAMQKKTGGIWRDKQGVMWIDPYRKDVWDYNIAIAKEAAKKGFKEIQFDYVRFPTSGKQVDREVAFYNQNGKPKQQVIADFLAYAKKELEPYNVYVSADIFGLVPSVTDDMAIGQKWELVTPIVDYISPMMYPSHYANGTYGLPVPDAKPYETIREGLLDAQEKDAKLRANNQPTAIIRPWYQDFTATWVRGHIPYGPREVLAQIRAGQELGVDQYLIWDAGNSYSEGAWRK
ncbi:putative glycoside hydrolase [Brevibacillus humidisoli]|uniref:putative glycoside hydrolase n=1 Tax=Brevibacillus humidisoli TaxID=2895522 RepID=UPI001E54E850|nr:putative glycoside hydrolase [Brevibacillus humidisoli]UFJ40460.1 putative glycoside hydrolase [Brevibacillus humidisoli]